MGLNERRKMKELQDVTFPGRVKEIEEICGAVCVVDNGLHRGVRGCGRDHAFHLRTLHHSLVRDKHSRIIAQSHDRVSLVPLTVAESR